jgi:hypothetical protein
LRSLVLLSIAATVYWFFMIRNRQGAAARFTGKSPPAGCQEAPAESIGSATMTQEGTIILHLRTEGPGGLTGDARFV